MSCLRLGVPEAFDELDTPFLKEGRGVAMASIKTLSTRKNTITGTTHRGCPSSGTRRFVTKVPPGLGRVRSGNFSLFPTRSHQHGAFHYHAACGHEGHRGRQAHECCRGSSGPQAPTRPITAERSEWVWARSAGRQRVLASALSAPLAHHFAAAVRNRWLPIHRTKVLS